VIRTVLHDHKHEHNGFSVDKNYLSWMFITILEKQMDGKDSILV